MNHTEVLNELLSNACASRELVEGINVYRIDLCCISYEISARIVGEITDSNGNFVRAVYEIVSIETVND